MDTRKAVFRLTGEDFLVEIPSGSVRIGKNALAPMELMLVSVGGCTAMDVQSILNKMRFTYDMEVVVEGVRREEHPRIYTEITITYDVRGEVPQRALERAVGLSLNRYCSATAMISRVTKVKYVIVLNGKEVKRGEKKPLEG